MYSQRESASTVVFNHGTRSTVSTDRYIVYIDVTIRELQCYPTRVQVLPAGAGDIRVQAGPGRSERR